MSNTIRAMERSGKPGKVRRDGFIPGVIYGKGIAESIIVKFETRRFKRILKNQGRNARINVKMGDDEKSCIIKDLQFDPITNDILHVDLQAVTAETSVKLKVPVVFNGREALESERLVLQTFASEVELSGIMGSMPEVIEIDVSDKTAGDKVVVGEIKVKDKIKILNDSDEVLAVISAPREFKEEETEADSESASESAPESETESEGNVAS